MEGCELCDAINEDWRIIEESKHSFCVICKWALKKGHLMVMPKRHVTQNSFSDLSAEEVKDLFDLVEKMQSLLNSKFDEDIVVFKNSGKHSSEIHFHFHVLPSKGALRDLFCNYENIERKVLRSQDWDRDLQKFLLE